MKLYYLVPSLQLLLLMSCGGGGGGAGGSYAPSGSTGPTIDPLTSYFWHLSNTGQAYVNGSSGVSGKDINLDDSLDDVTGSGVTVVVSDARIDLDHPEIENNANTSLSKNYTLGSPYLGDPTSADDTDSHGTAVSSLILGERGNSYGGYGVAPDATLVGYNFLDSDQSVSKAYDQTTVPSGNAIFNYSYGQSSCQVNAGQGYNYSLRVRSGAIGSNNVYITSAGNKYSGQQSECGGSGTYYGNGNLDQEKSYAWFIVTAATNASGTRASYSTPSANNWISAPGGDTDIGIMTADLVGCTKGNSSSGSINFDTNSSSENLDCSFYSAGLGTSYSAPVVSGVIALMREANSNLNWRDMKHILATTAVQVDASNAGSSHPSGLDLSGHTYQQGWVTNSAGYKFHPWYGFGQVDARAAINLAQSPNFDLYELKTTDSMSDAFSYTSGAVNLAIPDNLSGGVSSTINVSAHHLFVEHVQVSVNITHTYVADLGIILTSPSGTSTRLMNINSGFVGNTFSSVLFGANAFYGEWSRGNWTLRVVDGYAADTGTLTSWSISIIGNKGAALADATVPSPASVFSRVGGNLTWTASPSGDVARYELCIVPTASIANGCVDGDWRHVRSSTTLALNYYNYRGMIYALQAGTAYTAYVRAVDTSENESTTVTTNWTH
jgi:subtilisin-like proprotein convertase family protein